MPALAYLRTFVSSNFHSWPPVQLGIQLYGILASMLMAGDPPRPGAQRPSLVRKMKCMTA